MKNNKTKSIVGAVSLMIGTGLYIVSHMMNPADDTVIMVCLPASVILLLTGIIAIFSIKTDTADVTEDIDVKHRPLAEEAKTMTVIGNSLYILSFLEAVVMVWLDLDFWLYTALSVHMILNIIIAFMLRLSGKSRMEKIRMLMKEENAGKIEINITTVKN